MAPILRTPRILSIQSHVVSGYCGNKSATFPLQLLEFEVDVVNSVQLSNHTQYETTRGQVFRDQDLQDIHFGLKANNLLTLYDYVISGYVADTSYIKSMALMIKDIKEVRCQNNSNCWYTLDPVLGDDDTGFYVPKGEEIAEAYKEYLLPLADIITPNRFEASILSGIEIESKSDKALESALRAINVFHVQGIKVVVLTSFEVDDKGDELVCILSYCPSVTREDQNIENNMPPETWILHIPKMDCPFTGTGDLFTALITAWLHKTNFDIRKSFENTANTIHEVLEDTLAWTSLMNDGSVHSRELRLVQNKSKILNPKGKLIAKKIDVNSLSSQ